MKKSVAIVLSIVLLGAVIGFVFDKYYRNYFRNGIPVFNGSISGAKSNNTFLQSYNLNDTNSIFKEIWLEEKSYYSKDSLIKTDSKVLKITFMDTCDVNLKIVSANFPYSGFGCAGNVFGIELKESEIVKLDTLLISFISNGKRIDEILIKSKKYCLP